jgi:hypothetical protein
LKRFDLRVGKSSMERNFIRFWSSFPGSTAGRLIRPAVLAEAAWEESSNHGRKKNRG